jgi:NAD-dependent DNA ligase
MKRCCYKVVSALYRGFGVGALGIWQVGEVTATHISTTLHQWLEFTAFDHEKLETDMLGNVGCVA